MKNVARISKNLSRLREREIRRTFQIPVSDLRIIPYNFNDALLPARIPNNLVSCQTLDGISEKVRIVNAHLLGGGGGGDDGEGGGPKYCSIWFSNYLS